MYNRKKMESQRHQVMALVDDIKEKLTDQEYKSIADALHKPKDIDVKDAKFIKLTYHHHQYLDVKKIVDIVDENHDMEVEVLLDMMKFRSNLIETQERVMILEVVKGGYSDFTNPREYLAKAKINKYILPKMKDLWIPSTRMFLDDRNWIEPITMEVIK